MLTSLRKHRDEDNAILQEAVAAAKTQLKSTWSAVRVAGAFIVALVFGAVFSNQVAKEAFPSLEKLRLEILSPKLWALETTIVLTLMLFLLTAPRFGKLARPVYMGLLGSCYGGALLFGTTLGNSLGMAMHIAEPGELCQFVLKFSVAASLAVGMLLFVYLAARIVSEESMNAGFLKIWWRASKLTCIGLPLSIFLIALAQWIARGGII